MKLIDVLVKEMPCRGGWPEGVGTIEMHMSGSIFFDGAWAPDYFHLPQCDDGYRPGLGVSYTNEVTREQYEAALAASKQVAWSGEGLPPLGCVCEIAPPIHDDGTKVRVLCHDENAAVCRILEGDRLHSLCQLEVTEIRPIRTEAERKREEAVDDLTETIIYFYGNPKGAESYKALAERVIEAISIGKIPGIRLE